MKYVAGVLFCIGMLNPLLGRAQTANFEDGFEDGDYTNNPTWNDPEHKYIINDSNFLQLNAPASDGKAIITTPSTAAYGTWEVFVRLSFNPSSNNLARFYISSDTQSLKNDVHGYYIQIGGSDDEVSLYRQDGTKITKIIDGKNDLVDTNPVSMRVKVTRDINGLWELFSDTADGTAYDSQGTFIDNTYSSSHFVGFTSIYTSTRSKGFEYDDIKVTKILPPLKINKVTLRDDGTIDLTFNLDINSSSISTTDFSINKSVGNPDRAVLSTAQTITLSFDSPLASNQYTLTVNNIEDSEGNPITPNSTISFIIFGNYTPNDILINEFMYNPPDGLAEYIELKNRSDHYLNLQNWELGDETGSSSISTDTLVFPPHSFMVVSADTIALFAQFGAQAYAKMSAMPSFNNGGDVIQLRTAEGTVVDSLAYTPSWGGDGVALERRSDMTSSVYQENFGDSPHPNGGTPGQPNAIGDDTTPPKLADLIIVNDRTLELNFSERLDDGQAITAANYMITNGINISQIQRTAADSIRLSLASPLQNNTGYQLTIRNQQDIFGNTATQIDTTFHFFKISPVDSGEVFITEFLYNPPADQTEYVELFNASSKSLNLQGWTLNDNTGNQQRITDSKFVLPPHSYVVLAPDQTLLSEHPGITLIEMGSRFPSLNNSGDDVVLRDSSGILLDSLQYNTNWGGQKKSLERRTIAYPPFQGNFGNAPENDGSPGLPNTIEEDITPPRLTDVMIVNSHALKLAFSEYLGTEPVAKISNYTVSPEISISRIQQTAKDSVLLSFATPLQNNTEYQLTIHNQQDIFGNTATQIDTTFHFFKISSADSGEVFVNEFSYDPPEGSTEYIELYNPTSQSFDLKNWTLSDNTGERNAITEHSFILPPESYVVLAPDQTLLMSHPDITLIEMGSRFPSLNNNGDQIILHNAVGQLLDSLQYTSAWGGEQGALERRTTDFASFQGNFGESQGTPGQENAIPLDESPPQLTKLTILNNQLLEIIFSEQLRTTSATSAQNYAISGGIQLTHASFLAPDTVHLALSKPLQNNHDYSLTISGVSDLFGNTAASYDTTFTFFELSPVDSGEVFITEFRYAPASGQTEYVELYNASSKSLNLQDWTLNDNTGNRQRITDSKFVLPPKNYVVLAPDSTLAMNHPNIPFLTMGSRFPSLNNSGDDIVLRNSSGLLLDSLRYEASWGGQEVALERRLITLPPFQANFGAAPKNGGSPGVVNQILPDTQAPVLKQLTIIDPSTLRLLFSEKINASTATDFTNYKLQPSRAIKQIRLAKDTVTLLLKQPLQSEKTYQLTIQKLQDLFGNTIQTLHQTVSYVKYSKAHRGDIVINEIRYQTDSPQKPEFVELFNRSDKNFDLSGWEIGDAAGTTTIDAGTKLPAGGYLVLSGNATFARQFENSLYLSGFPSLNNDEDALYLQTASGLIIDSLYYTTAFGGEIKGQSAERKDPDAASNDASNFVTSTAQSGATPGQKNAALEMDVSAPNIKFAKLTSDGTIAVYFNEFIQQTDDLRFTVDDQKLQINYFNPFNGNKIILDGSGLPSNTELLLTTQNLTDVKGNVTATAQITVAHPLQPGDVVINEILFNPLADEEDGQADQSEYVELRNIRDYALSLEGITLRGAPDETGDVQSLEAINTTLKWIPAKGTALLYASENRSFAKSSLAQFFDMVELKPHTLIRFDRSSLGLAASGDAIHLINSNGAEIDGVAYNESWHNPNLLDTDGIALERINPKGHGNQAANWGSSTHPKGGTPGQENTLFQLPEDTEKQKPGIHFSPNPFSPDGDGYEDHLLINYQLGQPDYLISVRIYDRYGRLIRELADNKPAGFKGSLIWDGRKDNGTRNHIGIYIVIFKAYDSAGGKDIAFKKTVVLARRLH